MRRPILAANWKMHKTLSAAEEFLQVFLPLLQEDLNREIVIAPPATLLAPLSEAIQGSPISLAAQNIYFETEGAFTGEISPAMIREFQCRYAIVGHSERRALFKETDSLVARKVAALLENNILPIVCIGEQLEDREEGRMWEVLEQQLALGLDLTPPERAGELVIAYEPVWAIGTGKTATPEIAQETHAFIREQLAKQFKNDAEKIRIQYGGSVKPENVTQLMSQPDIDGALVGGASLDPASFAKIVNFEESKGEV